MFGQPGAKQEGKDVMAKNIKFDNNSVT